MPPDCFICLKISEARGGREDGFVAELRTGYVSINARGQYYRGYTIFACRDCVPELHELAPRRRNEFLREMSLVAEAVFRAFRPAKLNYELLGNSVPHLHWHLIPRYSHDPMPAVPAWQNPAFTAAPAPAVDSREMEGLRESLLRELERVAGPRMRSTFRDAE